MYVGFQSMLLLFLPRPAILFEVFPFKYFKRGYGPFSQEYGPHEIVLLLLLLFVYMYICIVCMYYVCMYVCENALSIRRGAQRSDVSAYQLAYEAVPISDSDHHLHGVQVLQRLCQRCRREVSVQLHTSYVYVCMYVQYVKQAEFATCIYGSICLSICTYICTSSMCIIYVCLYLPLLLRGAG